MNIYVAQVMTGGEDSVCARLQDRKIPAFSPHEYRMERRGKAWHSRERYLLPGYVLIPLDALTDILYYKIRETSGVIGILGKPPVTLSPEESQYWASFMDGPIFPTDFLLTDGKLNAVSGIWRGMTFPILSIKRRQKRVKICVPFFGAEREITVSLP